MEQTSDQDLAPNLAPLASLLILPDGAVNRFMGGGQRSGLFFEALARLGPVDVVVLGDVARHDRAGDKSAGHEDAGHGDIVPDEALRRAFFASAASLVRLRSRRFSVRPKRRLEKLVELVTRFALIGRHYRAEASVTRGLARIIQPHHRVVVFRYALPFCVSGLVSTAERPVFVDIDDRDDQKFASAARATLGEGLLGRVFQAWVVPVVRRRLQEALRHAAHLWYAAPEDRLALGAPGQTGPNTAILGNVPFFAAPADLPRPSASRDLLFVGTYRHRPNMDGVTWFLRQCWPALQARHPDSRLRIVGLGNWAELARQFPGLGGVDFVGTVPDIVPEYARARLVISPIFDGGGSKIKLIEACAFGRPAVAHSHSLRGFGDDLAKLVPQADTPEGFVAACAALLSEDDRADALGQTLRHLQEAQFSRQSSEDQITATILGQLRTAR